MSESVCDIKVSVCITTYNLMPFICQTLNSVIAQKTGFRYEILIGDDCSQDGTREILLEFQKQYPHLIQLVLHEKNIGVNRNDYSLITRAKGEYIAWLDGDDFWIDEYKLQKEVDYLDANPSKSCVNTAWRNFEEANNKTYDTHLPINHYNQFTRGREYVRGLLLSKIEGGRFSSILYRRQIVCDYLAKDSAPYLEVNHLQNDLMVDCILGLSGQFGYIDDITTVYRIRTNSLSMISDSMARTINYRITYLNLVQYWASKLKLDAKDMTKIVHAPLNYAMLLSLQINDVKSTSRTLACLDRCITLGYKPTRGERIMCHALRHPVLARIFILTRRLLRYMLGCFDTIPWKKRLRIHI